MRLISYLVLTIFSLSVFNQASGSIEHRLFHINEKIEVSIPLSDQDDFLSSAPMRDLIPLFQRSSKVSFRSTGHGAGGVLFLPVGREIKTAVNPFSISHYCIPISILLIFPKHYFF